MAKISVIIPVIRPELARRCIAAVNKNMNGNQYEIVTEEDTGRIGCPQMVKRLVSKAKYDLILFLGDDTIPCPNFADNALKAMNKLPDGWGLVGLNDGVTNGSIAATHWLADKRLLPLLDGEFFYTGYKHTYCDVELLSRCRRMGRYIWEKDARLTHDHPIFKGEELKGDYAKIYSKECVEHDRTLYWKRTNIRNNMAKILVATPLGKDVKIDTRTLMFLQEEMSHYAGLGWKWTTRVAYPVADARNEMIDEFLKGDYTHLFFLDADTIPPDNTISRLLEHDKDVVAGVTPVWLKEACWNYQIERDVKVHADLPRTELFRAARTGGTTILIKRHVLEKTKYPYYDCEKCKSEITGNVEYKTDDYYFCDKLHEAGFELWIDPTIVCGHMQYVNLMDMFFKEKNNGGNSR